MTRPVSGERRYDAILIDVDGTLVGDDGEIRPRTLAAVRAAHDAGVRVMLATGRSQSATLPIVAQLGFDTPAVVFNGAAVYCPVEERLVEERLLSNQVVSRAIAWSTASGVLPLVVRSCSRFTLEPRCEFEAQAMSYFSDLEIVAESELPTDFVIRVSAFSTRHTASAELSIGLRNAIGRPVYVTDFPLSALPHYRNSPLVVADVQPPCRGKAEGLRLLSERYGIQAERVVAVGDATNDIPMLEAAGLGVVMSNGMTEALAVADRVIGGNNSDALAELIEELFPAG